MRIIKSLLPLLLVGIFCVYLQLNMASLSATVQSALQLMPLILAPLVVLLMLYFNQARFLYLTGILLLVYAGVRYGWYADGYDLAVVVSAIPVLVLLVALMTEQGLSGARALLRHLLVLGLVLFCWWLMDHQPVWSIDFLQRNWLPQRYFDWTTLPQTGLLLSVFSVLVLLMVITLRQHVVVPAALGVLLATMLILDDPQQQLDLSIYASCGLLLLLLSVLQLSWRMAYQDELTGLSGRRALREKLNSLMGIYSIVMVDVDHFKRFNDRYGHDAGDDVLRMVAARLKQVHGGGSVYRYGGEEFTLVFPGKGVDDVKPHAEQLREAIAGTDFVLKGNSAKRQKNQQGSVRVTVSMGLADSITNSSTEDTLKQADKALYRAKKKGRNRIST